MPSPVWIESEFWVLVLCSVLLPLAIIVHLIRAVEINRYVLMGLALALLALACIDFILLGRVANIAHRTPDLLDDRLFLSEASAALYILPLVCAGVGINLLSFVITQHLRILGAVTGEEQGKLAAKPMPVHYASSLNPKERKS
jgi:hypothetical protein